jgi:hypothetical protein
METITTTTTGPVQDCGLCKCEYSDDRQLQRLGAICPDCYTIVLDAHYGTDRPTHKAEGKRDHE